MDGYTIDFSAAKQAAEQLNTILEGLAEEIGKIKQVESEMLSDANWKGPNKSVFLTEFADYEAAVAGLYQNGCEHLEALQGILTTYANAEQ